MASSRWTTITPSRYEWEREALDFIRAEFPDHEPYRAWSNFEFQTREGSLYEVDLVVLTKVGFWLVEIKSRPGTVRGDLQSWTWEDEGHLHTVDNPLVLANRKAKALADLLRSQKAASKVRLPYLEALVFLSAEEVRCQLQGPARSRVFLRDRPATTPGETGRPGIRAALFNRLGPGLDRTPRSTIDRPVAKAISRAMEQAGIRPSQKHRRVGDYLLGDLVEEGPGYQDRLAQHAHLEGVHSRVRLYLVAQAASEEERRRLARAAQREFRILQALDHPNILSVRDYKEHDLGPALLFHCEPEAIRLDQFLAERGASLDAGRKLDLLRQLGDGVRYAHHKRIVHRALGPRSVLVLAGATAEPKLKIFNWQVSLRDGGASSATTHLEHLLEEAALVYTAPEARLDPRNATEAADVFSLGALAYLLFSGRAPASTLVELTAKLRDQKGLRISDVLDGAGKELQDLVFHATAPDVSARFETVDDFLEQLELVEDELTAPEPVAVVDPLRARKGDRVATDLAVRRILGKGSTSRTLLVEREGQELVLKVALTDEDNDRLRAEAAVLEKLRSEHVVALHEVLDLGGRVALLLDKAGEESLGAKLRREGALSLDLLERFGEHLLSAVAYLEREGVPHRDIKPENLGIRSLHKKQLQLVLFDFSLSRAPLEAIHVGTPQYLDPFLPNRRPPRWDQAAELYAAGATLYEMATGVLPQWGDGRSDPASTDAELHLEPERFDPHVREPLVRFFERALARDPAERFDNAEEMLRAWRKVFEQAEEGRIREPGKQRDLFDEASVRPSTPTSALGLSTRAVNALDRVDVVTVRDLLQLPAGEIRFMRGVGRKTRDEIIHVLARLRERFPDVEERPRRPRDEEEAGPSDATLEELLEAGRGGWERTRPPFRGRLDLRLAYFRSRSFRKLVKDVIAVLAGMGCSATLPAEWSR